MKDYTIYCTPEQTIKALELGAPIVTKRVIRGYEVDIPGKPVIPTVDQMIGWLEEKVFWEIEVTRKWGYNGWFFYLYNSMGNDLVDFETEYPTRKEATIAAIDAALEYLTKNKK